MGNRTALTVTNGKERVVERHKYTYNDSNQMVTEMSYENGHTTMLYYTYDADGNRISETEKVCGRYGVGYRTVTTYKYDVENRLAAVYDGCSLLMAAAYDGDGNRIFQLNYNPYSDEHWGCGVRCGKDHRNDESHKDDASHGQDKPQESGSNGEHDNAGSCSDNRSRTTDNNQNDKHRDDEWENDSRNRCDILFPADDRDGRDHHGLINDIKSTGRHGNYELIEYINDVNREYTEVLVEENFCGRTDTAYIYGVDRLSFDYCNGHSGYYLYDPRGSVTGITTERGDLVQSYRYDAFGDITFGAPQYKNEYTYNGESYNPNIESQYLRARYYDVVNGNFLTEDSYLGNINEPLTLNRYNYCVSSPVNYQDPSGHFALTAGIGALVGGIVGLGASAVGEIVNAYNANKNGEEYDWKRGALNMLSSTVSGVVGGAVAGATLNPALAGAAAGATGGLLNSLIDVSYGSEITAGMTAKQKISYVAKQTVIGGASGFVGGAVGGAFGAAVAPASYAATSTLGLAAIQVAQSAGSAATGYVAYGMTQRSLNGKLTTPDDMEREFVQGAVLGVFSYGVNTAVNALVNYWNNYRINTAIKNSQKQAQQNTQTQGCENEGGTHVLPNAEDLKMSQTVQNHMNDVIKKGPNAGQLSRPYIDSDGTTLLLKEIMESADPVPDAILQSGLRWDVSGTFRGSTGTWELVVDTSTNTVVHFNFVAQ